jgi:uncharacterized protein YndB with AHSA1/START domain
MNVLTKPVAAEFLLTREFEAPRDRVFAAWTDVRQASRWWAPKDFAPLSCHMDLRPGGSWWRRLQAPDGRVITKHGVYREIVRPERLVFTYITENASGVIDPETLVTVTFDDLGGRTRLTLKHTAFETEATRDDHQGGWNGALDRFTAFMNVES